jgi:uncharacterized hydrophobic protein (TIGR00271 family)
MLIAMDASERQKPDIIDDGEYPRPMDSPQGSLAKIVVYGLGGVALILMMASGFLSVTATEEIIGFGLLAFGGFELIVSLIRYNELRFLAPAAMAIAVGVVLLFWPDETLNVAGLALAALIVGHGLLDIWAGFRRWHKAGTNSWILIRGFIGLVFGSFVLLFPSESVEFIVIFAATMAILRAVITVWFAVTSRGADATIDASDTSGIVTYWLTLRDLSPEETDHLEDTVFLFRGDRRPRLWRFAVFMSLATAIATFGIATDSTAVVIGAMLIAPLMAPILGVSAGLINGRLRSAMWSGLIASGGIIGVVALSWLLSAVIPNLQVVIANSQVTSRTAPNLLDLIIAIAAGIAGSYGVSRIEVSDALPGVAVSIALVPPLAVVGMTLQAGDLSQAAGASLLFLTNLFSIVLMAGLVFLLVGYGEWSRLYQRKDRIRTSFAIVALGAVLIAIPLALTGQSILGSAADLRSATEAVDEWLGEDSVYRVSSLEVDGNTVNVQLIGPGTPAPPGSDDLSGILADEVGRPMTTRVAWIQEQVELTQVDSG